MDELERLLGEVTDTETLTFGEVVFAILALTLAHRLEMTCIVTRSRPS